MLFDSGHGPAAVSAAGTAVQIDEVFMLSRAACRDFVQHQVFRLRPKDYCEKYPNWPGMVGLELEMGVLATSTLDSSKPRICPLAGENSLTSILVELAGAEGWQAVYAEGHNYLQYVQLNDDDRLTFEPGGQLEFSSKPYPCLSAAAARLTSVQASLDAAFAAKGYQLIQYGINPWLTVDEIGLQMTKPRYQAMDQYFGRIGEWGRRMMRQTCTVQVCLDFGQNEQTMAKRYLASNLLAPIGTALFANSPIVDGKLTEFLSIRGQTWRKLDGSRTGIVPLERIIKELSTDACVDAYYNAIMAAKVVFVTGLNYRSLDGSITFADWVDKPIDGVSPTEADLETHLSLYFPEVRARGFLELRSVDCQDRAFQLVPAAFYSGLLYDEQNLDAVLDLLVPHAPMMTRFLNASSYGLSADAELRSLAQKAMVMALQGYRRLPTCFHNQDMDNAIVQFNERFTARGRTPADDILAAAKVGKILSPNNLLNTYREWNAP